MKVIKLGAIDSTNTHAKTLLSKNQVDETTVIWTPDQTAGRGQQGNNWYASPGNSLTFSLIKRLTHFPADRFLYFNFAVSLGICRALQPYDLPGLCIKWPNDILSDGRKLGGILIETQLRGSQVTSVIAGVGINVNNRHLPGLPRAVSMYMLGHREYALDQLLEEIARAVDRELQLVESFESLKGRYEDLLFGKGAQASFATRAGERFEGVIQGVTDAGRLRVHVPEDASEREFGLHEVKMDY